MTIEQQLFVDSQRNSPANIHEAYDLLRVFMRDEFDPGLVEGFFELMSHEPDPDVAERRLEYLDVAKHQLSDEDNVDEDAWVAESATGAYVNAWVWVPKHDV